MRPAAKRIDLSRRLFLAAWGMVTLLLVFIVIFLVAAVFKKEQAVTPASATSADTPLAAISADTADSVGQKKGITLYFADSEACQLVPETRTIEFTDFTVENCRKALEALAQGPAGSSTAVMPASTKILGMYMLDGGELVVDFSVELSMELQKVRSATLESLLFGSIVHTLTQPALAGSKQPAVTKVRILIHGSAPREPFPAHVDVSAPLTPDSLRVPHAES